MSVRFRRVAPLVAVVVAAVTAAVLAGLLARDAARARAQLRLAERSVEALQDAVISGDDAVAASALRSTQLRARAARSATDGLGWRLTGALPYVGRTPRGVRTLTVAVDDVAQRVLPELVEAGRAVTAGAGGARGVDVAALTRAAASFRTAETAIGDVGRRVASVDTSGALPAVRDARAQLASRIGELHRQVRLAARALPVAASMLGADGPRRYFVALQNNAEARGTGGLLGAFAVVEARGGTARVLEVGANDDLADPSGRDRRTAVDLGADFDALYAGEPAIWQNTNLSPHFPYAAQLWLAMWRRQTGQQLDGAIAVDPTAASYVLRATGPVRMPSGEPVTADTVVAMTERDAYARFDGDNAGRNRFLAALTRAVFERVLDSAASGRDLLDALSRSVDENRLLAYSAHPDEQAVLATSRLAGELAPGPTVQVVVNNASSGKLEYYLHRSVTYTTGACTDRTRDSELTVALDSDVPHAPLPAYVVQRSDPGAVGAARGSSRLLVFLYLPTGSTPVSVTVDGRQTAVVQGRERGHPVVELPVELSPQRPTVVRVRLVEPAGAAPPAVRVQPLVQPQQTAVTTASC